FGGAREPAGLAPSTQRLAAALEVLADGPRARVERWLDALGREAGPAREDLRCALAAAGVLRLEELARIDGAVWVAGRERVPLPQRGALGDDASDDSQRPRRRGLETAVLRAAAERARAALDVLARWPDGADAARQRDAWLEFAARLGLPLDEALAAPLEELAAGFDELEGLAPGPERGELARWLAGALGRVETPPLGGAGAGVRVLDAQAARGAAYERLFVLGCERGVFPRTPRADALLGPAARAALAELAPELTTRERAEDDERWLLAGLLGAAPQVTLSWRSADLNGREIAPSPAVSALLAAHSVEVQRLERRRDELFGAAPLDARERALGGALVADRSALPEHFEGAFEDALARFGAGFLPRGAGPRELARARAAVLDELDPARYARADAGPEHCSGPYLGLAGAGALHGGEELFVTGLERLARCPWQTFLQRALGLEPPPDPLSDLPELDALVVGNAVHHALQELACAATVDEGLLQAALAQAAQRALSDAGVHLAGLTLALARRARPFVERGLALVAELPRERTAEVEGATPSGLRFRADLRARDASGAVLVDFKTGKPLSTAKKPETRREHLARAVARGTHLQAAAYAESEGALRGEYLFLRDDLDPELARVVVEPGGELAASYTAAVDVLRRAWQAGAVAPRPEDRDGRPNPACAHCEVRTACLRDDSGARARLRAAAETPALEENPDATLAALGGLWSLGAEDEE
ncbi:MAG TPA: PD-(D/E)XK nuclease family protein, partial [Planctomycetota bacterium]|nr:PD-(D/E)XK nuclease family protein [Planctomycetota bacterium]